MKVSVIIPVYNEEIVIGECLESLEKQSYKDLEVIVVDDGSTDQTLKCLSEFQIFLQSRIMLCTTNLKFKILHQQHKGPGEARNLGAKHANGKILVFVDADMTFDKEFVSNLVKPIEEGKEKGTWSRDEYVSNSNNVWSQCWGMNEGWEKGKRHPKNYPDKQKVFRAILKSEFEKVGGFESGGHYNDDWSLSEKLGYQAVSALGAKFYHKNPETLQEVFNQSKWSAKRHYKFGFLGMTISLIRVSFPLSIIIGAVKSLIHMKAQFLIFKIIYDLGSFTGIFSYMVSGKGIK